MPTGSAFPDAFDATAAHAYPRPKKFRLDIFTIYENMNHLFS